MEAYVYQAALWCEDCAEGVIEELDKAGTEDTGDSDDYPQGPYADGGGEADCPQHCDGCGCFLENPLTSEGTNYVKEAVREFRETGQGACAEEWAEFYDIPEEEEDDV